MRFQFTRDFNPRPWDFNLPSKISIYPRHEIPIYRPRFQFTPDHEIPIYRPLMRLPLPPTMRFKFTSDHEISIYRSSRRFRMVIVTVNIYSHVNWNCAGTVIQVNWNLGPDGKLKSCSDGKLKYCGYTINWNHVGMVNWNLILTVNRHCRARTVNW